MLHPYRQQLLHKQKMREMLEQAEHDHLLQLVNLNSSQPQTTLALYSLISQWWRNRWTAFHENQNVGDNVVVPEA